MEVVSAEGLCKTYPGGTEALRGVSFSLDSGKVFCLLGRNGAGKTTLLRILATQLKPSAGSARIFGYDVTSQEQEIRKRISVVPQEARPQNLLSAYDHIYYRSLIMGLSKPEAKERTKSIMEILGLWEHRDKMSADLSGGLRQRIIIGMGLVSKPQLLFLDEPTIGLDPLSRRTVWGMIYKMTGEGVSVILTTHYMEEAEALADSLAIIDKGRTIFLGTVEEAKAATGTGMRVEIESAIGNGGPGSEILTPNSNQEILEIVQRGVRENRKVIFKPPTLEEAFIKLVGGGIENEAA